MLAWVAARPAAGQSSYYNLDSGRPARIEDALPTARFRVEPKLSYGILPMTEIELRVPVLYVRAAGSAPTTGIASTGIGALHAFNVETQWPALALAAEAVLSVGPLSAPTGSYSAK